MSARRGSVEVSARRRWALHAAAEVARRPDLWPAALRSAAGLVPRRWWRRWPPLPAPGRDWWGFRMETAYGTTAGRPEASEVVAFLEWEREMRRLR